MTNFDRNDPMLYKFVVYQVKRMVCGCNGEPLFMEAFDRVFYDLYGVEDFSAKISRMYNNRGMQKLIDGIGLSQLIKLFKNPSYCNILYEMVMISNDLRELRKKISKKRKKGDTKHLRFDQREFNDMLKLYNKGIKALRKSLKIKDIHKAYKEKYKNLRNFIGENNRNDLYWDDIDLRGFDYVIDDDEDDDVDLFGDDFDPDNSTILEDFARALNGGSPRKSRRRREPFEYTDEYEDDDYDTDESIDKLTSKVNHLCNHMQTLSDTVQGLATQNRYNTVNNRKSSSRQSHSSRTVQMPRQNDPLNDDIAEIKNCLVGVVDAIKGMDDRLSEFEMVVDDDYDEPRSEGHVNQFVQQQLANMPQRPVQTQNASSIIDAINSANDVTPDMLDRIMNEDQ